MSFVVLFKHHSYTWEGEHRTTISLLFQLFHTLVEDVLQQRGLSVLDRFIWTYVTTAKGL